MAVYLLEIALVEKKSGNEYAIGSISQVFA